MNMKKLLLFIYFNLSLFFICITAKNTTGSSYKSTEPTYFYVTKNKNKYEFFYNTISNTNRFLSLNGEDLKSVLLSKKDHIEDFYIDYNGKLLRYKNNILIDDSINLNKDSRDNNTFITRNSRRGSAVWIGSDDNIYRTFLIFGIEPSCDNANLKKINQSYNLNITVKECNYYKQFSRNNAICVRQKYNKEQNSWNDEKTTFTDAEFCSAIGCILLAYENSSDKYEIIDGNNFDEIVYDNDEVLAKQILNKFKNEFKKEFDSHPYPQGISVYQIETQEYIIARCFKCSSFFEEKLFVLDKQLNIKTILYHDKPEHDIFFNFIVKQNKLFIRTNDTIYIYNLRDFKLIKKIENIEFFSFIK